MAPTQPGRPISRRRLAELADVIEHQSAVAGEPDWRALVAIGEELARGAAVQLRRRRRRAGER
jgi:hypothetical protein